MDAQGPQPPAIVVTGSFLTADGLSTLNGAYWNGAIWQALGNAGVPRATGQLFVHQGQLQTLNHRLNGTTWEPLQVPFPINAGTLSFPVSLGNEVALVRVAAGDFNPITVRTINYDTNQTQGLGTFTGSGTNPCNFPLGFIHFE